MNKKLKNLVVQAGFEFDAEGCEGWIADNEHIERFADLVRADEREACAALVEADGRVHPKAPDAIWAKTVAKLIRARGEHD
jgi:hypothetical protein